MEQSSNSSHPDSPNRSPGLGSYLLGLFIAIQFVFLYGASLLLATLTVSFRDIQFLVQNLMMVWFLATPIAYPFWRVADEIALPYFGNSRLFFLNPATSMVLPYQEILFFRKLPHPSLLAIGLFWAVTFLALGVRVFEKRRNSVVEEI